MYQKQEFWKQEGQKQESEAHSQERRMRSNRTGDVLKSEHPALFDENEVPSYSYRAQDRSQQRQTQEAERNTNRSQPAMQGREEYSRGSSQRGQTHNQTRTTYMYGNSWQYYRQTKGRTFPRWLLYVGGILLLLFILPSILGLIALIFGAFIFIVLIPFIIIGALILAFIIIALISLLGVAQHRRKY